MNLNVIGYSIYLAVTIYITVVVGYGFYKNGIHLIINLFNGNTEAANAINKMLLVGYYLVNIGYLSISIGGWPGIGSSLELIQILFHRVSIILLALGVLHINNMVCLYLLSKRKTFIKFLTH